MSELLLRIRNVHATSCDDPPIVNNDNPNLYVGYFENAFGEQWIFTYDRTTGEAVLRGGDIGWNTQHDVSNGSVGELILGPEETTWFQAC